MVDEHNLLIYCGTGKIHGEHGEEVKQIDEVCKLLGNDLGMKIARYTASETTQEREIISEDFYSLFPMIANSSYLISMLKELETEIIEIEGKLTDKKEVGLINILDEMVENCNKFKYRATQK